MTSETDQTYFGILMPTKVVGLRRGTAINNEPEHPGMGFSIPYNGLGIKATVYIYDMELPEIPEGPQSSVVLAHFRQALHDIEETVTLGVYDSAKLIDKYGTGTPERGPEFLCAEFAIKGNGEDLRSYIYLTGHKSKFVKVRITMPTYINKSDLARDFADELAILFWSDDKQADPLALNLNSNETDWVIGICQ